MRTKKFALIIGLLGVFVMSVGMTSALAEPATKAVSSTGWEPFSITGGNPCLPEDILMTGMTLTQQLDKQDSSGGLHILFKAFTRGTAVGLTSGAGYVFSEIFSASSNTLQGEFVSTSSLRLHLISLDQNTPDSIVNLTAHINIDADGNPKVDFFFDNEHCN